MMKKGVTLLISIVVLTAAMSIALGIAYIVLAEFSINQTARESYDALYAADFGKECALFYHSGNADPDLSQLNSFWDPSNPCFDGGACSSPSAIRCGSLGVPVTYNQSPAGCGTTIGCQHIFDASVNNVSLGLCSRLRVISTVTQNVAGSIVFTTLIESHGVNNCNFSDQAVNRSIEVCDAPPGQSC